jgi:signal transduction histidine kinase
VAVLRYRLWDLDFIVRKTAIYSIVAVGLVAVYVVLLGLAGVASIPTILFVVLTFNPVQRQIRRLADRIVYGGRASPYEVLSEFSERVGETYSADDVLPRMTELLRASTGAKSVRAWLGSGDSMRQAAVAPPDTERLPDVALRDGKPAFGEDVSAFPVTHQGELLGAITLRVHANDPMNAEKGRLAQDMASQAGLALRNVRLVDELRASRRRIVTAQDARAKQLERNIHDGVQQQLVALAVQLKLLQQQIERDPRAAEEAAGALQTSATTALEDLRDLARGIYPPLLADKGLPAALEAQALRAPVATTVEADGVGRYPQDVEAAVYFCTLEAMNNVAKYAEATHVGIHLADGEGTLTFEVSDDGRGFDSSGTGYGTGLQGIADRLAALGGDVEITSSPGAGTTIAGRLPTGT